MRRSFFLSFLALILFLTASSQRIYFIYFQTESQQAFFIKMDEKLYSSTSSGYLILSRLKDSTYTFTIGFPGNQFPEQKFSCPVSKKDHGFIIKNFGEKGWGLIDLQTQAVQMAVSDAKKDVSVTDGPVNAFTDLLSKAADDPTLKQKIVLPDEKKPETAAQVTAVKETKKDSVAVTTDPQKSGAAMQTNAAGESLKKDSAIATGTLKTAVPVNKPGESLKKEVKKDSLAIANNVSTTGSTRQISAPNESGKKEAGKSVDSSDKSTPIKKDDTTSRPVEEKTDKADTGGQKESKVQNAVNSELPSQQPVFAKSKIARTSGISTTEGFDLTFTDTYPDGKQDLIKIMIPDDNKTPLSNDSVKDAVQKKNENLTVPSPIAQEENSVKAVPKNTCRQIASDADFYKLRKKMASGKSDASMLLEANKVFRVKCFTSSQIKNLSSLFLGDGGKYSFFDAAYSHVSDAENFSALQSELKDEYFINRFKAMLR